MSTSINSQKTNAINTIATLTKEYAFLPVLFDSKFRQMQEDDALHYLETAIKYALESNLDYIEAFIPKDNSAISIYKKLGFKVRETNIYFLDTFQPIQIEHEFACYTNRIDTIDTDTMNMLYQHLSESNSSIDLDFKTIRKFFENNRHYIFSVYDGDTLVATATIIKAGIDDKQFGIVEDVVGHPGYTGKRLGDITMNEIISFAQEQNLSFLTLTSKENRINANKLYQRWKFALQRNAAVYRLTLTR